MTAKRDTKQWDRKENFGKFFHLLWDLGLVQNYLKTRDDLLVLLAMLRCADFDTGECVVFISRIMRETGIKHPTQVQRCQEKIESMGAFLRPEGKAGFKLVGSKWLKLYIRATGAQIVAHAIRNNLIDEETMKQIELRRVEKEIEAEAEKAGAGSKGGSAADEGSCGIKGLDDIPETIDGILDQIYGDESK